MKSLRFAILPLVFILPLRAQHILLTEVNGQILPIQAVRAAVPQVMVDGHWRAANRTGPILHAAPLYQDASIVIEDFEMANAGNAMQLDTLASGTPSTGPINFTVTLTGYLTASAPLENCFLVFESLGDHDHPASLGTVELPRLEAGRKRSFRVPMSLGSKPEEGKYHIYIFSGARECRLATKPIPPGRGGPTDASYLAQTANASPAPIVVVSPDYPPGLVARNLAGSATIHCQLGVEGDVLTAAVLNADQPDFGAAAEAALRQWIFRPAVRNHQFVPIGVYIPFSCPAPGAGTKG
jgi:TonB family protein